MLLVLIPLLIPALSQAEIITQRMEKGLIATAEYLEGDLDAPGILIQHGFLQTRDFFTVRRLAESLHEAGYTILLPNLTLGLNARKQSLSCEAIHTHSMDQDTREISSWVHWLFRKTHQKVVLIGHSGGSLNLTAFLYKHMGAPVSQSLLISLISSGQGPLANESPEDILSARDNLIHAPRAIREYGLSFCKRYPTTARNYLSYTEWDQATTLKTLRRLRSTTTVILGGKDKRITHDWGDQLKHIGVNVQVVEDANHFFDQMHEFDLLEMVEDILEQSYS